MVSLCVCSFLGLIAPVHAFSRWRHFMEGQCCLKNTQNYQNYTNTYLEQKATSNKCIASSNKCLTSSNNKATRNKKLLVTKSY